jgi:transposase
MPELGHVDRRRAASLAACAPHPRDSGTSHGHRTTTGGRRQIRPPLFTAALAAIRGNNSFAETYRRLLAAGKPKRLAINAIMRHIIVVANARLRSLNDATGN